MSYNDEDIQTMVNAAISALTGGSGSGGRRGGRGSGSGGRGGIHKDTKSRCYRCRSSEHLIADCPHKGESRRKVRQRLREAPPAQETLPAAAEQPDLPPTSPTPAAPGASAAPAPAPSPAPASPAEQPTVSFAMPRDEPQSPPSPPPAAEPQTGRPLARLGRTVEWSALFNRYYYVHYLDGSVEWYEQQ